MLIPWQGWALTAHDFLVTRLMETLVHSDDLPGLRDLMTDHEALDEQPIEAWARKLSGNRLWERLWAPLLDSKFDGHYDDLPATYLWSRMRRTAGTRSQGGREVMGAIEGGYQALVDRLAERIRSLGGEVHTSTPVRRIPASATGAAIGVVTDAGLHAHDTVVTTQLRPNLDGMLADRARVAAWYREALGASAESGVSAKCLSDAQGGGDARGRILRQVHVLAGRAPHRQATVERGDRQVGRLRELLRAALEQHPVTRDEQALGGERRGTRRQRGPRTEQADRDPVGALHDTFTLVLQCADSLRKQSSLSCEEGRTRTPEECTRAGMRRLHVLSHLNPSFLAAIAEADRWLAGKFVHGDSERSAEFWRQLLAKVSSYADIDPTLVGAVEQLIDFVTAE